MNKILIRYCFFIWAYLISCSFPVIAAQDPNSVDVYVGISLNTSKPSSTAIAPGRFLSTYFAPMFTNLEGQVKNTLHTTFFHGTAAKVGCYATSTSANKQVRCFMTGEAISREEKEDLEERLKATYDLVIDRMFGANKTLAVTLKLTPQYRESQLDPKKYFVMLDFDKDSREKLLRVLKVFRTFINYKNYDFHLDPEFFSQPNYFPLDTEIESWAPKAETQIRESVESSPHELHYIQKIKRGLPVYPDSFPICCKSANSTSPQSGCLDISRFAYTNPALTKCFIIGARKWYTGKGLPASHVTLTDHSTSNNADQQELKEFFQAVLPHAIRSMPSLALTKISGKWNKVPENAIKGALFSTTTRQNFCDDQGRVKKNIKKSLEKLVPSVEIQFWVKACRQTSVQEYFNDEERLKDFRQFRPEWDNYYPEKATLFSDFPRLTKWLLDNRLTFDLKELDFHS